MTPRGEPLAFVGIGSGIAAVAALALAGFVREGLLFWSLAGWAIMSAVGIVAGAFMLRAHGRPGSGFLAALAAGMLARLFLSAAGAAWASRHGTETVWAFLGGLLAAYLPLQVFELTWFIRRSRRC